MHCKHTYTTGRPWYIQGSCLCNLVYSGIHIMYSGLPWYKGFIPWYVPYALVYNSIQLYTMVGNCMHLVYLSIPWYKLVFQCIPLFSHWEPWYSLVYNFVSQYALLCIFCTPVYPDIKFVYPIFTLLNTLCT